ncbi:hypothetical protein D3C75_1261030 [compost metagenome]
MGLDHISIWPAEWLPHHILLIGLPSLKKKVRANSVAFVFSDLCLIVALIMPFPAHEFHTE